MNFKKKNINGFYDFVGYSTDNHVENYNKVNVKRETKTRKKTTLYGWNNQPLTWKNRDADKGCSLWRLDDKREYAVYRRSEVNPKPSGTELYIYVEAGAWVLAGAKRFECSNKRDKFNPNCHEIWNAEPPYAHAVCPQAASIFSTTASPQKGGRCSAQCPTCIEGITVPWVEVVKVSKEKCFIPEQQERLPSILTKQITGNFEGRKITKRGYANAGPAAFGGDLYRSANTKKGKNFKAAVKAVEVAVRIQTQKKDAFIETSKCGFKPKPTQALIARSLSACAPKQKCTIVSTKTMQKSLAKVTVVTV